MENLHAAVFGAPSLSTKTQGGLAVCRTALVAGELAEYALSLQLQPHTAGEPSGPKTTRTSGAYSPCYEATLQNIFVARVEPSIQCLAHPRLFHSIFS